MFNNIDLLTLTEAKDKTSAKEEISKQLKQRAELFYMPLSNPGLKVLIKLNHGIKSTIIRTKHK